MGGEVGGRRGITKPRKSPGVIFFFFESLNYQIGTQVHYYVTSRATAECVFFCVCVCLALILIWINTYADISATLIVCLIRSE